VANDLDLDVNRDNDLAVKGPGWVNDHWEQGMQQLMRATRALLGPDAIIIGNGPTYGNAWTNGQLNEGFADLQPRLGSNNYGANLNRYADWHANHFGQMYYVLSQNPDASPTNRTNFQEMRYWLGTALLGDGFFGFSGPSGGTGYRQTWWYDEYSVDLATGQATGDASRKGYLGYPTGAAQQYNNGMWRRDYDNGIALVNPTGFPLTQSLETRFRVIQGTQDLSANSGGVVWSVTIAGHDARILLTQTTG
jgi:hypothetical protein